MIRLRDMRPDEYDACTAERERDTVESLAALYTAQGYEVTTQQLTNACRN